MTQSWTKQENDVLLSAIEQAVSIQDIISTVTDQTTRSENSVLRRLTKIGYLRNCGRSFKHKQGFVR